MRLAATARNGQGKRPNGRGMSENIAENVDFLLPPVNDAAAALLIPRDHPHYPILLRRSDLALLRRAIRCPGTVFSLQHAEASGWVRLTYYGFVRRGLFDQLWPTDSGRIVAKHNASCRDGTEADRELIGG